MLRVPHSRIEIRHFHLFCGLGGGARGFNRGRAEVGSLRAQFRCIGGVDVDAAAVRDFGCRCPDEIDLKKVEKFWFLDLLTDGRICR
jgi:site-specific DNA-cytosine methylase